MRTDLFRARGTDGRSYIVFRRTPTYSVKTMYGPITRQGEPKFYLGNGDPLECVEAYDTFRTLAGDLVVRLVARETSVARRASTGAHGEKAARGSKRQSQASTSGRGAATR